MFDNNIKYVIEQHNKSIIYLKDTVLDLKTQNKNNNNLMIAIQYYILV